jgi:hypothetical protein
MTHLTTNGFTYYPPGPVGAAFLNSDAFLRGIRGPVGSGKSTVCIMDMLKTAQMQRLVDGRRKYRGVIIRNTYGELETTTIKSFHMWVPPSFGRFVKTTPISHSLHLPDGQGNTLDMEFLFLALDRPEHVRKLLSLEVTQGWINEAREVPKAVLDHLTVRVGRYPSAREGGAVRAGVIMDTNSPDADHWWPKMSDLADTNVMGELETLEAELRAMNALAPKQKLVQFFTQPPAEGADGKQNPKAENLSALPPGYYVKAKAGKSPDWIAVYIRNEYGFVMDGKPVYPEYRDSLHVMPVVYAPHLSLHVGLDFGLTPAAVFLQRTMTGQIRVLSELVATRLGAKNFAREIRAHLAEHYPNATLGSITGDPAGEAAAQTDETTVFQMLASEGVEARPAPTNDFTLRREAVATPLSQLIDGAPALVVAPGCKHLRKGMAGGYHFRRVKLVSEERYEDKPVKSPTSHVCEALQYAALALGLGKEAVKRPASASRANRPKFAEMEGD